MKKIYERPMMKAEAYSTNEFVCACSTDNINLTVDIKDGNWLSKAWVSGDNRDHVHTVMTEFPSVTGWGSIVTRHTFIGAAQTDLGPDQSNQTTRGWKCTCEHSDGSIYYLEHSNYLSSANNVPIYVLYKDNGDGLWQIQSTKRKDDAGTSWEWPYTENHSADMPMAVVGYTSEQVLNS